MLQRLGPNHRSYRRPPLEALEIQGGEPPARLRRSAYYSVKTAAPGERRAGRRWRTYLRSGKILGAGQNFSIDCQIYDRSSGGARLRLFTHAPVPRRIQLFDEIMEKLYDARVIWRSGCEIGICFARGVEPRSPTREQLSRLRARSAFAPY
ncbi:MAG TPA: hypothetical protein VFF88_07580 [Methylocella sp.]|nr:hypothetical protein [Methylocella sp.]